MAAQAIERATPQSLALREWGEERLKVLKEQIAVGASNAEMDLFAAVCKRTGLDPFARQIWSIQRRRKNQQGNWESYQVIQIGVHGLRLIAARSREYQGQVGPFWCGEDGVWRDVWLDANPPKAARVGVRRKGFSEPIWSVAVWDRAVQKNNDGKPQALWATSGPEQLARTAERDALRRAFPIETADVEALVDPDEVQANAAAYTRIFGTEEDRDLDGIPPGRALHAGRTIEMTTGEVIEDRADGGTHLPSPTAGQADEGDAVVASRTAPLPGSSESAEFRCVTCKQPILDPLGKPINDNQRDLILQRFGRLECRACRELP